MRVVRAPNRFAAWAGLALSLVDQRIAPDQILWTDEVEQALLPGLDDPGPRLAGSTSLLHPMPRTLAQSARYVLLHRDQDKWRLLYRVLWRLHHETSRLMQIESDPDVHRLRHFEHQVRHDAYRMTQFVRFRKVEAAPTDHYIAWHRPDHDVLRLAAPFFVKRFAALTWSILTPDASAHWDRRRLTFGPGVPRREIADTDDLESLWQTYYATTCNPARINPRAMAAQMPKRFWEQLPEAREIAPLLSRASEQVAAMVEDRSRPATAAAFVPHQRELPLLAAAARLCQGCELHGPATQTVFGAGPKQARIMLVGEQPGDEEDRQGIPFVGPAGTLLDRALAEAQLDRTALYMTNAVKHFRFIPAGRARRHQAPRPSHIVACRPWLDAEIALIRPQVIVCLGATAARSLLGYAVRVMERRGAMISLEKERRLLVTIHPAAVLRAADEVSRQNLYHLLVADLRLAAGELLPDATPASS